MTQLEHSDDPQWLSVALGHADFQRISEDRAECAREMRQVASL